MTCVDVGRFCPRKTERGRKTHSFSLFSLSLSLMCIDGHEVRMYPRNRSKACRGVEPKRFICRSSWAIMVHLNKERTMEEKIIHGTWGEVVGPFGSGRFWATGRSSQRLKTKGRKRKPQSFDGGTVVAVDKRGEIGEGNGFNVSHLHRHE